MKKNIKYLLIIGIISLPVFLFGQTATPRYKNQDYLSSNSENFKFLKVDFINESKIVYFYINNIIDEVHKKNIYQGLIENPKIHKVEIDNNNLCIAKIDKDVSPDLILDILKSFTADFKYEYIQKFEANRQSVKLKPIVFTAKKDYDNNRRIAYFSFDIFENQKQAVIVQEALLDLPEIYKLENYDKNSIHKFMMECENFVDEKYLNEKIAYILSKESIN